MAEILLLPERTPPCLRCHGFGSVHPRREDDTIDYSSLVYCRCHDRAGQVASPSKPILNEPERYHEFTPEMIDFPVSWDFHRMYSVRNGLLDPGDNEAPLVVPPVETPKAQIVYRFVTKPMPEPDRVKAAQRVRQVRENKPVEGIEIE